MVPHEAEKMSLGDAEDAPVFLQLISLSIIVSNHRKTVHTFFRQEDSDSDSSESSALLRTAHAV